MVVVVVVVAAAAAAAAAAAVVVVEHLRRSHLIDLLPRRALLLFERLRRAAHLPHKEGAARPSAARSRAHLGDLSRRFISDLEP